MATLTAVFVFLLTLSFVYVGSSEPDLMTSSVKLSSLSTEHHHYLVGASDPVSSVLALDTKTDCSAIFLTDQQTFPYSADVIKTLDLTNVAPHGTGTFDIWLDTKNSNRTKSSMIDVIEKATKLRKASRCVYVVVFSEDPAFLSLLAEVSLKVRLIGWPTKLLVVTRLDHVQLNRFMSRYWIYSLMNAMFVNREEAEGSDRWVIYSHYPYSPEGPVEIVMGFWQSGYGLQKHSNHKFFPDKYQNFHGGVINVTSLTHTPYWMEKEYTKEDGTKGKIIYGTDGLLLHVVAEKLNFTFYLMPADDWDEVERLVITREAYMSPVYWDLIPERLEKHDMTFVYEHAYFAFSMATTPSKPHWTSLYFPLTNEVWLSVLGSCVFASVALSLMLSLKKQKLSDKFSEAGTAVLEIVGTLLDQTFVHQLPQSASGRTLIFGWLVFSFVIGSAYRANLTAHLMLPKPQQRAETVEELVEVADVVTGETYSESTKVFFMKSDYPPYKKLGERLDIGYETSIGMRQALNNKRSSHVDFLKHMHHVLVDKFTRPDGSSGLYIGKSNIVYLPSSWPMSHDTPFLPHVDKIIMEAVESGIIDKWYEDEIEKTRIESMKRQKQHLAENPDEAEITDFDAKTGQIPRLSLGHLQGPFTLLAIGLAIAFLSFLREISGKLACCRGAD